MTNKKTYKIAEEGKIFIYDDIYSSIKEAREVIAKYREDDANGPEEEQRDVNYWIIDAETGEPVE